MWWLTARQAPGRTPVVVPHPSVPKGPLGVKALVLGDGSRAARAASKLYDVRNGVVGSGARSVPLAGFVSSSRLVPERGRCARASWKLRSVASATVPRGRRTPIFGPAGDDNRPRSAAQSVRAVDVCPRLAMECVPVIDPRVGYMPRSAARSVRAVDACPRLAMECVLVIDPRVDYMTYDRWRRAVVSASVADTDDVIGLPVGYTTCDIYRQVVVSLPISEIRIRYRNCDGDAHASKVVSVACRVTSYATHSTLCCDEDRRSDVSVYCPRGVTTASLTKAMVNARASSLAMAVIVMSRWRRLLSLPGCNDEVLVATHYTIIRNARITPKQSGSLNACFPMSGGVDSRCGLCLTVTAAIVESAAQPDINGGRGSPHWCRDQDCLGPPDLKSEDLGSVLLGLYEKTTSCLKRQKGQPMSSVWTTINGTRLDEPHIRFMALVSHPQKTIVLVVTGECPTVGAPTVSVY